LVLHFLHCADCEFGLSAKRYVGGGVGANARTVAVGRCDEVTGGKFFVAYRAVLCCFFWYLGWLLLCRFILLLEDSLLSAHMFVLRHPNLVDLLFRNLDVLDAEVPALLLLLLQVRRLFDPHLLGTNIFDVRVGRYCGLPGNSVPVEQNVL